MAMNKNTPVSVQETAPQNCESINTAALSKNDTGFSNAVRKEVNEVLANAVKNDTVTIGNYEVCVSRPGMGMLDDLCIASYHYIREKIRKLLGDKQLSLKQVIAVLEKNNFKEFDVTNIGKTDAELLCTAIIPAHEDNTLNVDVQMSVRVCFDNDVLCNNFLDITDSAFWIDAEHLVSTDMIEVFSPSDLQCFADFISCKETSSLNHDAMVELISSKFLF